MIYLKRGLLFLSKGKCSPRLASLRISSLPMSRLCTSGATIEGEGGASSSVRADLRFVDGQSYGLDRIEPIRREGAPSRAFSVGLLAVVGFVRVLSGVRGSQDLGGSHEQKKSGLDAWIQRPVE
jgi:hypothetical protein